MMMMSDHGDGWWIFMLFWMVLLWIGVVAGSFWLVRSMRGSSGRVEALEILDRRLANGEIEVEEHRSLKAELTDPIARNIRSAPVGWIIAAVVAVGLIATLSTGVLARPWDRWDHMGRMHGGGRDTSGSSVVQAGMAASVTIEDFSFRPGNIEIAIGAKVTWTNEDAVQHDATARDGTWQTKRLSEGENDRITFAKAGEYDYFCSIHPAMKARLVVR